MRHGVALLLKQEPKFLVVSTAVVPFSADVAGFEHLGSSIADATTYGALLRQCANAKALCKGRQLHSHLTSLGQDQNTFLGNLLVQMYGNCGSAEEGRMVFDGMHKRNVFSWNIMTSVYAQNGHLQEARTLFETMPQWSLVSWNTITAAYARRGYLEEARNMFSKMPEQNVVSWNAMLAAYAQNGHLNEARRMFDEMPERDVVSWNTVMSAYVQDGNLKEASSVFEKMPQTTVVSWNSIVAALAQKGQLDEARSMFNEVPEKDVVSWNAMITAYVENEKLEQAKNMFDEMPSKNVASWNAMISAYIQEENVVAIKTLFDRMPQRNLISWTSIIAAYVGAGNMQESRKLFEKMPERNVMSWTAMISAYATLGQLAEARSLFDKMPETDVVSWTSMIAAYAPHGHVQQARSLFDTMPQRDTMSWTSMVTAYAQTGHLQEAKHLFEKTPHRDVVSYNAMISAYVLSGNLEEARRMFEEMGQLNAVSSNVMLAGAGDEALDAELMPEQNVVSWNSMVAAYAQNGQGKEALKLFRRMDLEGIPPDNVTFVSVLDACSSLSALDQGRIVYSNIVETKFISDVAVATSLVNMFGKCGNLRDARIIFDNMPERSLLSWNTMIAAYAQNAQGAEVLKLFRIMALEGAQPDDITMLSILSACSHAGLISDSRYYFVSTSADYGVQMTQDHYLCMIDLLSRLGQLEDAEDLIEEMPFEPDAVAWRTLLSACRVHGDIKRAVRAAEWVPELDPENGSSYVLLANICVEGTGMRMALHRNRKKIDEFCS